MFYEGFPVLEYGCTDLAFQFVLKVSKSGSGVRSVKFFHARLIKSFLDGSCFVHAAKTSSFQTISTKLEAQNTL